MKKRIPRHLIAHLEWKPGQEIPQPTHVPHVSQSLNIESILAGKAHYCAKIPDALQVALDNTGYVATMPELIAAKSQADEYHDLWVHWHTAHTEENIGIDKEGAFYGRGDAVLVVVHGGGILTPSRIEKAYDDGLIDAGAQYNKNEFNDLLKGRLPNGDSLQLYRIEEVKKGISNLPHRCGIVMPYAMAKNTTSGFLSKHEFMNNNLVIARNGGVENLDSYFEKAKRRSDSTLGNLHGYGSRDPSTPQGRLLFLFDGGGLQGNYPLNSPGRFVEVEAPIDN